MTTTGTSTNTGTTAIALIGAGGNMGTRLSRALIGDPSYTVLHVEAAERAIQRLRERGCEAVPLAVAVSRADVVILAVPDNRIGPVAAEVVPRMRSGGMAICLDPAAPFAGVLPEREDISYFVTHPAHPPVFNDETDWDARRDFFGSGLAKQAIVNALMQGPEADYARGEAVARAMWRPVLRSHRVTVEQMAILEPALSETVAATCLLAIRKAMDEAIRRGVPPEAARDFLMGHINIELAIIFNEIDWNFSAGAQQAMREAESVLFQPDWKKVFEPEQVQASVRRIAGVDPA
jgi:D-apionate oxidoisomerase